MRDYTKDPTVPLPVAGLLNDIQRALVPDTFCDCCGLRRPVSRCIAYGIETFACDECRNIDR